MPNILAEAKAECPFFQHSYIKRNHESVIVCEGCTSDCNTTLVFAHNEKRIAWMEKNCYKYPATSCPIANMCQMKYEEGKEQCGGK